jgi:hypothetical protein
MLQRSTPTHEREVHHRGTTTAADIDSSQGDSPPCRDAAALHTSSARACRSLLTFCWLPLPQHSLPVTQKRLACLPLVACAVTCETNELFAAERLLRAKLRATVPRLTALRAKLKQKVSAAPISLLKVTYRGPRRTVAVSVACFALLQFRSTCSVPPFPASKPYVASQPHRSISRHWRSASIGLYFPFTPTPPEAWRKPSATRRTQAPKFSLRDHVGMC